MNTHDKLNNAHDNVRGLWIIPAKSGLWDDHMILSGADNAAQLKDWAKYATRDDETLQDIFDWDNIRRLDPTNNEDFILVLKQFKAAYIVPGPPPGWTS